MTFFDWVRSVGGVAKAAKLARVSERVMATWFYSERVPKPETAKQLIRASKGQLDFNSIYGPLLASIENKRANQMIKRGSSSGE